MKIETVEDEIKTEKSVENKVIFTAQRKFYIEWYGKKFRFINFVHFFKFSLKRGSQLRGSTVLFKLTNW